MCRATILFALLFFAGNAVAAPPPDGPRHHKKSHHRRRRGHSIRKTSAKPASAPVAPLDASATVPEPAAGPALIIPVEGVRPDQLVDTFSAARGGGRVHDAIDILAPRNTPVLAATGGTILKLKLSERGGITIYQLGDDHATIYYYAHLDHYPAGLVEGQVVRAGDVIGFAGDSGNAKPGNCHLHFSIWRPADPARYWEGVNLNPFPLLRSPR